MLSPLPPCALYVATPAHPQYSFFLSLSRSTMATEDKLNDYDFTGTDAGASHTIPSEAGQIRKGGYIVIKGHPCKVRASERTSGT